MHAQHGIATGDSINSDRRDKVAAKQRDACPSRLARDKTVSDPRDRLKHARKRRNLEVMHEKIGDDHVVPRMILPLEPGEDVHGDRAYGPAEIRESHAGWFGHKILAIHKTKTDLVPRSRPALREAQKQ